MIPPLVARPKPRAATLTSTPSRSAAIRWGAPVGMRTRIRRRRPDIATQDSVMQDIAMPDDVPSGIGDDRMREVLVTTRCW